MEIKTFYFNPLRTCCYVAWDGTGECVIIDPGCYGDREFARLEDFVRQRGLNPVMILLTHAHFDHTLGLEKTAGRWKVPVMLNPGDKDLMVTSGEWCRELGLEFKPFTGKITSLEDGQTLTFGETSLEVLSTPGHTPGGVCFLCRGDGVLFTGDTLFAGSIGRTDHLGGDYDQLIDSITRKIIPLDGETTVLPGHGPSSTVGYERATNPFIQNI